MPILKRSIEKIIAVFTRFLGMGYVSAGLLVGALASFAALPFYSRFYETSDFGAYGLVISIVSVGSTFAGLRLDQAILVAPREDRYSLAVSSVLSGWGGAVLFSAGCLFFASAEFAGAVALGIFANCILQVSYSIIFSEGNYRVCGLVNAARSMSIIIPQLVLPIFMPWWKMVYGVYIQSLVMAVWGVWVIISRSENSLSIVGVVRKYKDFIFHNTPHAMLNSFSHNLPYYAAGTFVGEVALGFYAMVDRILKTPIYLFSQVIRQSFIKKFSEVDTLEDSRIAAVRYSFAIVLLAAPFFLIFFFIPENFYKWLLGAGWGEVGSYFSILSLGYLMVFSNPPVSAFLIAARRSDILLKLQVAELAVKSVSAMIFHIFLGGEWIFLSITVALIFYNVMCFFVVMRSRVEPSHSFNC